MDDGAGATPNVVVSCGQSRMRVQNNVPLANVS